MTAFIFNVTFDAEESDDFVRLRAPDGRGVRHILFFQVAAPTVGKNRMHVDLATRDPEFEIPRLRTLGAQLVDAAVEGAPQWREGNGTRWVVLRDPEGNEFCIG